MTEYLKAGEAADPLLKNTPSPGAAVTRIVRGGQRTGLLSAVWSPSFRQEQLVVFILREIYSFCLAAYLVSFPRILILSITMEQDSS